MRIVFILITAFTLLPSIATAQERLASERLNNDANSNESLSNGSLSRESLATGESDAQPEREIAHETFASRHFRVLSLDVIARDLYSDNAAHVVTDREIQYKVSMGLQLNFDGQGNTYLGTRTETGNSFGNSWDNTGQGLGTAQTNLEVKAFFLGQKVGRRFEFQLGGIEFDQGSGSQATYAAGEAYLTGYRLRIVPPTANWMPDTVSFTGGQVSDFTSANVFSRLHRLGDLNYVQVMMQKKIGDRDTASLEGDSIGGIGYLRGAVRVNQLRHVGFDDFMLEAIGRVSDGPEWAWSARAGKDFDPAKRWRAEAIYVAMPLAVFASSRGPVLQNWGEFGIGQRIGANLSYRVSRDFSVSFLGSRRTDDTPNTYRWRGFVAARYDFAPLAGQALRHLK
ncbi:MAG TPA: hypothetical protein VFE08_16375 [Candidatus Sulfotelmatobacter sp.]|nr:hypothetical protein [Candidatus Sulfotelmatobacter sp.]